MKTIVRMLSIGFFVLLNLSLALTTTLVGSYPILGDEYVHIAFARQLVEEGVLPFTNPYFLQDFPHVNFQWGFHFLLAGIYVLLQADVLLIHQLLVGIAIIVNSLLLYYLVRLWTSDHATALLSMFFFGTITTTGGMLAHHYFIPLTVGTTLLFLLHIFWHHWSVNHNVKSVRHLLIVAVLTAITYPPALLFFAVTVLLFILSHDHSLTSRFNVTKQSLTIRSFIYASFGLLGLIGIALVLNQLDRLFFYQTWDVIRTNFSPLLYLGSIVVPFFVYGLYCLISKKSGATNRIVLYWFISGLLLIYINYVFNISILLPFPRLFFFYLIAFTIIVGIGAATFYRAVKNLPLPFAKSLASGLLGLVILLQYFGARADTATHQPIITTSVLALLNEHITPIDGTAAVVADTVTSLGIYPATGKHVAALLNANVGGGEQELVRDVLYGDCLDKKIALHQLLVGPRALLNNPDHLFVLHDEPLECPDFTLVASNTHFLYSYPTTIPFFTGTERAALIPDPPPTAVPPPPNTIVNEAELRDVLTNNVIKGATWEELYLPNGHVVSENSFGSFAGVWDIKEPFFCNYDLTLNHSDCMYMSKDGKQMTTYNPDGTRRHTFEWIQSASQ